MIGTRPCASCGRAIADRVARCPFCNALARGDVAAVVAAPDEVTCPWCRRHVPKSTMFCVVCKREVVLERPTTKCAACLAPYLPSLPACPRCGVANPVAPSEPDPAPMDEAALDAAAPPVEDAPAPRGFVGSAHEPVPESRCPLCRGPSGARPLKMVTWRDRSGLFDAVLGRTVFRGQTTLLPGPCGGCAAGLRRSRVYATLLIWLPIPVLMVGLLFEPTIGLTFALLALYGYAVILRSPSYSWSDAILYGAQLTTSSGAEALGADQVDFPVHWAHALLRVLGALVLGFLSLVVMAVISGP